jgi:hypothetical protein
MIRRKTGLILRLLMKLPPAWFAVPPGKPRFFLKKFDWFALPIGTAVSECMIYAISAYVHKPHNPILWTLGLACFYVTMWASMNRWQMSMYRQIETEAEQWQREQREWDEREARGENPKIKL